MNSRSHSRLGASSSPALFSACAANPNLRTMSDLHAIERRLRVAEATNEIIRLKSLYAEFADAKYTDAFEKKPEAERDAVAWEQARCFTEDGEFSAGSFGDVRGHQ